MNPLLTRESVIASGNYFVATNPTIGSAQLFNISGSGAYSATAAMFQWRNTNTKGRVIVPDKIRLITAVGLTSVASTQWALTRDSASRAPTSGNATIAGINTNGMYTETQRTQVGSPVVSICTFSAFSAGNILVLPAAGADAKLVGRGTATPGDIVAADEITIQFGGLGLQSSAIVQTSRVASILVSQAPGIVIGAGFPWLNFHFWTPTVTSGDPTFEWEVSWWESN